MESVTLGQIATILAFIVGFVGSIEYLTIRLKNSLKSEIKGVINNEIEPIKEDIKELKNSTRDIGISDCKNFLVNCYVKIESGQKLDETEKERCSECYDLYTIKYKQNSYIHSKHEKLVKEGKL